MFSGIRLTLIYLWGPILLWEETEHGNGEPCIYLIVCSSATYEHTTFQTKKNTRMSDSITSTLCFKKGKKKDKYMSKLFSFSTCF